MMKLCLPRMNLKAFEMVWNEHVRKDKTVSPWFLKLRKKGMGGDHNHHGPPSQVLHCYKVLEKGAESEARRRWLRHRQGSNTRKRSAARLTHCFSKHPGIDKVSAIVNGQQFVSQQLQVSLLFTFYHVWQSPRKCSMAQPCIIYLFPPRWTVFQHSTCLTDTENNWHGQNILGKIPFKWLVKSLSFAVLRRSDNPTVLFGHSQILMRMKTRGTLSLWEISSLNSGEKTLRLRLWPSYSKAGKLT